jgi:hypothetical protein
MSKVSLKRPARRLVCRTAAPTFEEALRQRFPPGSPAGSLFTRLAVCSRVRQPKNGSCPSSGAPTYRPFGQDERLCNQDERLCNKDCSLPARAERRTDLAQAEQKLPAAGRKVIRQPSRACSTAFLENFWISGRQDSPKVECRRPLLKERCAP